MDHFLVFCKYKERDFLSLPLPAALYPCRLFSPNPSSVERSFFESARKLKVGKIFGVLLP